MALDFFPNLGITLDRYRTHSYGRHEPPKCAHCGKRYLGASANGNGGRYRYYVCFSRQRYGKKACEGERLPAATRRART